MNKNLYLPALRGFFGDWVYYSCIMPLATISKMVNFADELHNSKNLSELIQRTIKKRRGNEIASYLTNEKERFFNSLVVAVYGGAPSWRSIGIVSSHTDVKVEDISESSRNSFGRNRRSSPSGTACACIPRSSKATRSASKSFPGSSSAGAGAG